MLEWLFPNEQEFYARFSGVVQRLNVAAALLEQAFEEPGRMAELATRIQQVDQEVDAAAYDLDLGAERMFIPPMDREDVHLLSTRLSRVVDIIGGTARRAVSLRAVERHETAVTLASILVRATKAIEAAIEHIRDGHEVLARCREIKRAEEQGDLVWQAAVTELFTTSHDPLDVLGWKTLYDRLEEALDACEDVANELETITIKHA
jgi:uncharacterized protein Yka (UPF0111/DUF47 family)